MTDGSDPIVYGGIRTTGAVRLRVAPEKDERNPRPEPLPHKSTLVSEAVRHLMNRQLEELRQRVDQVPIGRARTERALDIIFELYRGPLFCGDSRAHPRRPQRV